MHDLLKILQSLNQACEQNTNPFNVYLVCFCVRVDARVVCTSDEIQRNIVRVPVAFVRNELQQFQHSWPHICLHKAVDLYRNYNKKILIPRLAIATSSLTMLSRWFIHHENIIETRIHRQTSVNVTLISIAKFCALQNNWTTSGLMQLLFRTVRLHQNQRWMGESCKVYHG